MTADRWSGVERRAVGDLIRARAPLRLGLAGGGTDVSPYCDDHGGAVLNVTIDRFAFASVTARNDGMLAFRAADSGVSEEMAAAEVLPTDAGLRLHRGVYNRMVAQFNAGRPLPLTLTTHVDSPMGSGLGSSSALVVAMVEALRELIGAPLGEYEVAHLAFQVEREDLALNGGRQDQYAAAFGGFNFIEFGAGGRVVVNPLRVKAATSCELEASLLLYFTGASRNSAGYIDEQSAAMRAGGNSLAAMHLLKADAVAMKEAVLFGRTRDVAEILDRGWQAKKRTASVVTNPDIDQIYDFARANGAMAGKVSGAGGGGFMMFLVDPTRRTELVRALTERGDGVPMICQFTTTGAANWRVR